MRKFFKGSVYSAVLGWAWTNRQKIVDFVKGGVERVKVS